MNKISNSTYLEINGERIELILDRNNIAEKIYEAAVSEESIVSINRSEDTFLQTAFSRGDEPMLSSKDENSKKQMIASSKGLTVEKIIEIFCLYAQNNDQWQKEVKWQGDLNEMLEIELKKGKESSKLIIKILVLIIFCAALLFTYFQINSGSMNIKDGMFFIISLATFGIYIFCLSYFILTLRPCLAKKLGDLLNVTILDGFVGGKHGWYIKNKAPFYLRIFVSITDIVLSVTAIMTIFIVIFTPLFLLYKYIE